MRVLRRLTVAARIQLVILIDSLGGLGRRINHTAVSETFF